LLGQYASLGFTNTKASEPINRKYFMVFVFLSQKVLIFKPQARFLLLRIYLYYTTIFGKILKNPLF